MNESIHVAGNAADLDAESLGRRLLPPGSPELLALTERRPWRVILDAASCYVVFVAAFALVAVHPAWWTFVIAFLAIGSRQYALSVLTHDGDHRTLFQSRRANDLFCEIVLCSPVGVDFPGEKRNHGTHHRTLATEADPDRYLYVAEDKANRLDFVLFLTGLTMFPRTLRKALRGGHQASAAPQGSFLYRRRYTLVAQALIFGAVCLVLPWWCYLVLWLGPVYPLVFVPHKVRMFCEHAQPLLPDAAADGQRLITYLPPWIERVLFTPFNLHLHAEHHMFPFVPYYNLPRLRSIVMREPSVIVRGSYAGFIAGYFARLPIVAGAGRLDATR